MRSLLYSIVFGCLVVVGNSGADAQAIGVISNFKTYVGGQIKVADDLGIVEYVSSAKLQIKAKCLANNGTANSVSYEFDWTLSSPPDSGNISYDPVVPANSTDDEEKTCTMDNCTGNWVGTVEIHRTLVTRASVAKITVTFKDVAVQGGGGIPDPPK